MKVAFALLVASIATSIFVSLKLGILVFIAALAMFGKSIGLFQRMDIIPSTIPEGLIYVEDYTGSYKEIGKTMTKMFDILKKFKKPTEYSVICLDHSNPYDKKTDLNNCKVSVGIFKKKGKNFKVDEDIEKYCKENGMIQRMITKTNCLHADWKYSNFLGMIYGIRKFYPKIIEDLNNPSFCSVKHIKKEDVKLAVEIYERNKKGKKNLSFNMPLENHEQFNLFGLKE
ncbi:MAG: hypothetical protein MJ252_16305 [archaeon]|nr:hypothetical protein [archaeon]